MIITEPELVEIWDEESISTWQDYHLSGMSAMISSINLGYALLALADSGMLARLRAVDRPTADQLIAGGDPHTGHGYLRYLTACGILERWQERYRLTRRGTLLTADLPLARLGFYLQAYGPVTSQMADLVTGTARYGIDVERDAGAVGRRSGTVTTASYVAVVHEAMRRRSARSLLDLGCGDGSLLLELCRRSADLTGVGIDIAPESVALARRRARRDGLGDRARFEVADAFDPATWPADCAGSDLICGVGVLHELFRDGDDAVVDTIDRYAREVGTRGALLIGEPELRYDDQENDSDFYLVHVLSAQGIPRSRRGWFDVFDRTTMRCRRVYAQAVAGPRTSFYELTPVEG